jgi:hypothetical protein
MILSGRLAAALAGLLLAAGASPSAAEAHGPIAPIATSYLARVSTVPPGLDVKVIDGDLRIWLRAAPSETVVILDYRGAPYLRFSSAGVEVNQSSAMYYLNQTPVELVPSGLTRSTAPRWSQVSGGHEYGWHDGRVHALATVALSPGITYVGRWTVPVLVNGHLSAVSGGLWHADDPPLVWFWPIVVLLACVLAARRLHRSALDRSIARALAVAALIATAIGGAGRELHGRPMVSVGQLILLASILAFAVWGLRRVLLGRAGYFGYFVISFVTLWVGGVLIPTLLNGFVLMAVPAFVARAATVTCLASGAGLALVAFRLAERPEDASSTTRDPGDEPEGEDPGALASYV